MKPNCFDQAVDCMKNGSPYVHDVCCTNAVLGSILQLTRYPSQSLIFLRLRVPSDLILEFLRHLAIVISHAPLVVVV